MMRKIDLETYKRRASFEAFKNRDVPYFSTTSNVDITSLKEFVDRNEYGFFVPISFLISKSVNLVPELRHRIVNGELFQCTRVDPGYTVLLDDETFSFCDSRHFEYFGEYREHANARINEVKKCPDRGTREKQHVFFISNIPWFSFTSIVHPYYEKYGSIPIVSIGKYSEQGNKFTVPIGIQVHHGVVDGIHVGKFYKHLSSMCHNPAVWLG